MSMTKQILLVMFGILILSSAVYADYSCSPTPITISINTISTININEKFTITATTSGVGSNVVYGQILDSISVLQTVTGVCSNNICTFNFNGLSTAGDYTVRIYTTHPATNTMITDTKLFNIKPGLAVSLSATNTIFYYGSNIVFRSNIYPDVCSNEFIIAKCNQDVSLVLGNDIIPVTPDRSDLGGGVFEYSIPPSQIPTTQIQKGQQIMTIKLKVTDLNGNYGVTVAELKSLTITTSTITSKFSIPAQATIGDTPIIKLNFYIGGSAVDVDTFTLKIDFPQGGSQSFSKNDMIHQQSGEYILSSFKLTQPQNYYLEVSNIKANVNGVVVTGVTQKTNIAVSGGSNPDCGNGQCESEKYENDVTCPVDCGADYCGNGKCGASETSATCPADCGGSNTWIYVGIGAIVLIAVIIIVVRVRKK